MEEKSKVSVRIYGQEYIIAGETQKEHIIKIANYVDEKMTDLGQKLRNGSTTSIAVLSAVNIADEYFKMYMKLNEARRENEKIAIDTKHYQKLWDESKNSFIQYKQDSQKYLDQLQEKQDELQTKNDELNRLNQQFNQIREYNDQLEKINIELKTKIDELENTKHDSLTENKELVEKYKDIENSFFDLQMENIQLKSELEKLKKD